EVKVACGMLADAGVPLGAQTVLLKGINDDPEIMKRLVHQLLLARVKPYYLYQADLTKGTNHFRTTVETGMSIIRALQGHTSGMAVPHFVIDAPRGEPDRGPADSAGQPRPAPGHESLPAAEQLSARAV